MSILDECWEWTGARNSKGYGHHTVNGKIHMAHRTIYAWINGEIPKGMLILHSCDNPSCVNPAHLRMGTAQENTDDMIKKGRQYFPGPTNPASKKGELSKVNKLVSADIPKIRADMRSNAEIAKDFGVSRKCIWYVKARRSWAHIR